MKTLLIEYPDTLPDSVHLSDADFQKEARLAMAVKLFEMGKLTSGQAAQLAGIPRSAFIHKLSSYGVNAIDGDEEEGVEFVEGGMRLLNRAYDENEPEYTTEMIREPNPDYSR